MTITIDCRHIAASGIGVYLRECLPRFLETGNRFLLLGDRGKLACIASKYENAEIADCGIKSFSFRELLAFPRAITKKINKTCLFYSPYFNIPAGIKVPVYTTIHDIIFPDMPELISRVGFWARMWFYRRAYQRSKKIFTVSQFSKSRIEFHLGKKIPVIVTHSAIQPHFLENNFSTPVEKTATVLFIGNIKKHKGLSILLDAFFGARKRGLAYKLIIVGEKNNFRSADSVSLEKLNTADSSVLEFTGFISDEKLRTLLAQTALLVQPSLYEGFGLPPLEAMICGTKALISDIPVFREIYGDFPVTFFRAGDAPDLETKLLDLLLGKQPEQLALPDRLASRYTFEKTASVILKELTEA
jgi:glycosyltransferase involved in cell wall biosynthesis